MNSLTVTLSGTLLYLTCQLALADAEDIPVSGRPVATQLEGLDVTMQKFMSANAINAGVLGIMQNGRIIYLRGFGWGYDGAPLPENALFRVASVTKPITAAAVRQLVPDPVNTNAFNLEPADGGLLDCIVKYQPWEKATPKLDEITVDHLLRHRGGWDRDDIDASLGYDSPDLTRNEVLIGEEMGGDPNADDWEPPTRAETMRWILSEPMQFEPGSESAYSNVGYLALGLIAEELSGQDLITYIRQNVLTPAMWVPATELIQGRTFRPDQNDREPGYNDTTIVENVYNPDSNTWRAYGGWNHEARLSQGGIVTTAATLLTFADNYRVGKGTSDQNIGQPLTVSPLNSTETRTHDGVLPGTNSALRQRGDGYRTFVVFNKSADSGSYSTYFLDLVDNILDASPLPTITRTSDGFWTTPSGGNGPGRGGYNQPIHSFAHAVTDLSDGSKVRLFAGTSNYTGVITKRLLIDAPEGGNAVIGPQ